ncbi:hypothetical protein HOY80DRAFT_992047 [Tuber brumale]|nr:hypothetical protein HOY80DRAFT_992047 [Tuber brumale]
MCRVCILFACQLIWMCAGNVPRQRHLGLSMVVPGTRTVIVWFGSVKDGSLESPLTSGVREPGHGLSSWSVLVGKKKNNAWLT